MRRGGEPWLGLGLLRGRELAAWLALALGAACADSPSSPSDASSPDGSGDAAAMLSVSAPHAPQWVPGRLLRLSFAIDGGAPPYTTAATVGGAAIAPDATGDGPVLALVVAPPPGASTISIEVRDRDGAVGRAEVVAHTGAPVAAGMVHTGATVGTAAWTWGGNPSGQLGRTGGAAPARAEVPELGALVFATTSGRSLGVTPTGEVVGWGDEAGAPPRVVAGLPRIAQVAVGGAHQIALDVDGRLWTWGANGAGQLGRSGDGAAPAVIDGPGELIAACAGSAHTAAISRDGVVWAWGANGAGQLGQGAVDGAPHAAPVVVDGIVDPIEIACGRDHVLALGGDGRVWAWGRGASGQLGHGGSGNLGDRAVPTELALSGIAHVIAAGNTSWAIDREGVLWAWGQSSSGQLGVGSTAEKRTPTRVDGLRGVLAGAGGATHAVFRTVDGRTFATGGNDSEQLGRPGSGALAPIEVVLP